MNLRIFKHNNEWIVLNECSAITFHQSLADAMDHASTQIRQTTDNGTAHESHQALNNR